MGRPTSFSEDRASAICAAVSQGCSLRTICRREGMPSRETLRRWLSNRDGFSEAYQEAVAAWERKRQADKRLLKQRAKRRLVEKLLGRVCTCCGESKSADSFGVRKYPSGTETLRTQCKACDCEQQKARYASDPERHLARNREWNAKNRERRAELSRLRRLTHGPHPLMREYQHTYRLKNKGKIAACNRQHRDEHPDVYKGSAQRCRNELSDGYVRNVIRISTGLKAQEIPQAMVDVKREHLRVVRLLMEIKK